MTYGWAILVGLTVIGALSYFGVFSFQGMLPEKCELGSGLECVDYHMSEDSATLVVQNTLGREITITKLSFVRKGESEVFCVSLPEDEVIVAAGATASITCTGRLDIGGRERFEPTITFDLSGEKFVVTGDLFVKPAAKGDGEPVSEPAPDEPADQPIEGDFAVIPEDLTESICTPSSEDPYTDGVCSDGIDNDCDGSIDCKDTGCADDPACAVSPPEQFCQDSDNDGYGPGGLCKNGEYDCDDKDFEVNPGSAEICDDGIDNNCNGFIDCDDVEWCSKDPVCNPPIENVEICDNKIDDDFDKYIDCQDTDCANDDACPDKETICDDKLDNDKDGLIDCLDLDCKSTKTCL